MIERIGPVAVPEVFPVYVIAEAGSCHEERISNANELVRVAAEAQATAVKFQYWSNPARMRERRRVSTSGAYDHGSIRPDWFSNLRDLCHEHNLSFACSVYLPEDVQRVAEYVDVFKVSSFEANDIDLLYEIQKYRDARPWFISTGMQESRRNSYDAVYLHCVSYYPQLDEHFPLDQASLGAIEYGEGYSDHTRLVFTGAMAVAAGADYLEVHFRLNTTSQGCPDYTVSLTPEELKSYVKWANIAKAMRGTGLKEIQECERPMLQHRVVS